MILLLFWKVKQKKLFIGLDTKPAKMMSGNEMIPRTNIDKPTILNESFVK